MWIPDWMLCTLPGNPRLRLRETEGEMPYKVEMVKEVGYVAIVLTGNVSRSEHNSASEEGFLALADHDCNKLLVNATQADHRMPVAENFDFASTLPMRLPPGVRIAIIVLQEDFDHLEFFETVARNRGVNIRIFADGALALEWLLDE